MDFMNLRSNLPKEIPTRRYMLIKIQGKDKLACHINGEWVVDSTCKSINEMLDYGIISTAAISGWISEQCFSRH